MCEEHLRLEEVPPGLSVEKETFLDIKTLKKDISTVSSLFVPRLFQFDQQNTLALLSRDYYSCTGQHAEVSAQGTTQEECVPFFFPVWVGGSNWYLFVW